LDEQLHCNFRQRFSYRAEHDFIKQQLRHLNIFNIHNLIRHRRPPQGCLLTSLMELKIQIFHSSLRASNHRQSIGTL